jgi:hypothetical protein
MRAPSIPDLVPRLRIAAILVGIASCGADAGDDPLDEPLDETDVDTAELDGHPDGTWTRLSTTGPALSERSTPAVAAIGHRIYVFGGARDDAVTGDVQIYDDLHRFDTVKKRWDVLTPAGPKPPPRVFAASVAHAPSRRMLVFGGAFFGPFFSDFSICGPMTSTTTPGPSSIRITPVHRRGRARRRGSSATSSISSAGSPASSRS